MFKRHRKVRAFYEHLDIADLNDQFSTNREEVELEAILQHQEYLNLATTKLQCDTITISDARALFNRIVENFPELSNRLSSTSFTVENALLERAIAKI